MKRTPYFAHDNNASEDPKILSAERELGPVAYAYYFKLLELMDQSPNYKLEYNFDAIFYKLRIKNSKKNREFFEKLINDFSLFERNLEENSFYSLSFLERKMKIEKISSCRQSAGRRGAESHFAIAKGVAKSQQNDSIYNNIYSNNNIEKENIKGEEEKEKENETFAISTTTRRISLKDISDKTFAPLLKTSAFSWEGGYPERLKNVLSTIKRSVLWQLDKKEMGISEKEEKVYFNQFYKERTTDLKYHEVISDFEFAMEILKYFQNYAKAQREKNGVEVRPQRKVESNLTSAE